MKMKRLAGPGFHQRNYIGPIPEEVIGVRLAARKIPSEAWQKAHPPGQPCEPPTDADMVVQVVTLGSYGKPSRLQPPHLWPTGQFPVSELACVPYLDWVAAGEIDLARQRGELKDEPPTEAMPDPKMEPALPGEEAAVAALPVPAEEEKTDDEAGSDSE